MPARHGPAGSAPRNTWSSLLSAPHGYYFTRHPSNSSIGGRMADGDRKANMSERRAALVTGAASGIGRAVARRLVDDGYDVLAVDLEPDESGPGVPHRADLVQPGENVAAVHAAQERFGRLDLVVPNAGVQHVAPIDEFPGERWETILALLLTSPFVLAKHAWPALKASGSGRFVVIASVHGLVASPFKVAYVSAKNGVL